MNRPGLVASREWWSSRWGLRWSSGPAAKSLLGEVIHVGEPAEHVILGLKQGMGRAGEVGLAPGNDPASHLEGPSCLVAPGPALGIG